MAAVASRSKTDWAEDEELEGKPTLRVNRDHGLTDSRIARDCRDYGCWNRYHHYHQLQEG